ncbi:MULTISPECIES: DUF2637 domain-containing protein [Micromonospora]|nr:MULTISPECIES: DUF2637 domain-containing protein [Micromonospora]
MTELALRHGQFGWKAYASPVSVDGLEIVASLHLVGQRRAGRRTGWVPWVTLVVATLASLAANVAVGGDDLMGKGRGVVRAEVGRVATFLGPSASNGTGQSGSPASGRSTGLPMRADASAVAQLLAAAGAALATLERDGRSLSRDALADAMRDDGVSNARVLLLLRILRAEQAALPASSASRSVEFRVDQAEAGDDVI